MLNSITKRVIDRNGDEIEYGNEEEKPVFHVGVYSDKECKNLVQGLTDKEGNPLDNPITIEAGETVSFGVSEEKPTYYFAELDGNGGVVGENYRYIPSFARMHDDGSIGLKPGDGVEFSNNEEVRLILTNKEREMVKVGFDLEWDDYDNRDSTRGDYQVALYAHYTNEDGAVTKTEQIGEPVTYDKDVLEGEWTNLYKYDLNGNEIKYTVKETNLPDKYTTNAGEGYGVEPDKEGIAHLKNVYRANEDKPVTPTEDPNKGNDDSGDNITDDNVNGSDTPADDEAKDSDVQTGDSTNIMLLLAMMITSIMLGGIILLRARRKEIK